jgi:hypothetical protein
MATADHKKREVAEEQRLWVGKLVVVNGKDTERRLEEVRFQGEQLTARTGYHGYYGWSEVLFRAADGKLLLWVSKWNRQEIWRTFSYMVELGEGGRYERLIGPRLAALDAIDIEPQAC